MGSGGGDPSLENGAPRVSAVTVERCRGLGFREQSPVGCLRPWLSLPLFPWVFLSVAPCFPLAHRAPRPFPLHVAESRQTGEVGWG